MADSSVEKKGSNQDFMRQVEECARKLREQASIGPTEKLDPLNASEKFNFVLAQDDEVARMLNEQNGSRQEISPKIWSGMASPLPNGKLLIMLNPNQTQERKNVTILEEVAHRFYEHKSAQFNGNLEYDYDDTQEEEAYQTAAAILLPMKVVAQAVWTGKSAGKIASEYGTSVELVEMRIKRLNLWSRYQTKQANQE